MATTDERPWPDSYPVENVKVTMGMTLPSVDEAEYTDLRRQGLIAFDDAEQPTTPAATDKNEQE